MCASAWWKESDKCTVHGGKRVTSVQCMMIELVVASGNIPQLGHFIYNGVLLTLPTSHFANSHFAYLGA